MIRRPTTNERRVTWFARQAIDHGLAIALIGLGAVVFTAVLTTFDMWVDPHWGVTIVAYAIATQSLGDLVARAMPSYFGLIKGGPRAASTLPLAATTWLFGTWLERTTIAAVVRHEAFYSNGFGRIVVHLVGGAAITIAIWATHMLYSRVETARTCPGTSWGLVFERHAILATMACVTALTGATYLRLLQAW